MEPGIHLQYDETAYHSEPGLSSTGAKLLIQSPAKYRHQLGEPLEPTPAMRLGTCIHTAILGVGQEWVVVDGDRRTKDVKAEVAEHEAAGKIALARKDADLVNAIADKVRTHNVAKRILSQGSPEVSMCWVDEETGATCRGRIDWLNPIALVDVKSTVDASRDGFMRQAANLHMDLQAAAYIDGYKQLTGEEIPFLHIAVERDKPHMVAVHQLPNDALERGAQDWEKAKRLYADCIANDTWPGGEQYPDDQILTNGRWPAYAAAA